MSRRLKRQLGKGPGGRGIEPSPRPRAARTPLQRLNRILLIGGGGLAIGAVLLALLSPPPFDPGRLGVNLLAIGLGLLMGKGAGRFLFRRMLPSGK